MGKSRKRIFRNIVMCTQLYVCIFFLGAAIAVYLFSKEDNCLYFLLSDQETGRILCLQVNSATFYKNKDAILSQIKMLPGVEEISVALITDSFNFFLTSSCESTDHRTLIINARQGDPSYFQFFRIPFQGEAIDADASKVVYISGAFRQQLDRDSIGGDVKSGEESYRILGTYKTYYGENLSEHSRCHISVFFSTKEISTICIRFRNDIVFSKAEAQIEEACRSYVPESLVLDIGPLDVRGSTTQGVRGMMDNISLLLAIISILLVVLSVYSAISMDTVSRQREVATRRINGATPKVIVLMFGRVYIVQFILACMIAYPSLRLLITDMTKGSSISSVSRFAWDIHLFTVIGLLIFVTTAYEIYRVIYFNPAGTIKNE